MKNETRDSIISQGELTLQTLKFDVHGMTCGGCTSSVERVLNKIDGVSHVDVSLQPGTAILEADTARVSPGQIEAAISSLGYQARLHPAQPRQQT